eukprot:507946-Amphidinium_carterae.1
MAERRQDPRAARPVRRHDGGTERQGKSRNPSKTRRRGLELWLWFYNLGYKNVCCGKGRATAEQAVVELKELLAEALKLVKDQKQQKLPLQEQKASLVVQAEALAEHSQEGGRKDEGH